IDPEFSYNLNGKHYAQKVITLNDDGVYKIRATRPFAAYSFGYDWCDSYGYPTSAALIDLEKPDTIPPDPQWMELCDGTTMNADGKKEFSTVTDKPDDPEVRSNLAMIVFYDDSSYNYDFEYATFIPGEAITTTWKLTVIDKSRDAKAVISFMDRRGNDTTIRIYYYAPDISIIPDKYDFGRLKLGDEKEQDFQVINNSDQGPWTVYDLKLLFGNQNFTIINTNGLPYTIPPKGNMKFKVKFSAVAEGDYLDSIGVGDTCTFYYKAVVKGRVGNPIILVGDQPNLVCDADFGKVTVGDRLEKTINIRNTGTAALLITGFEDFSTPDAVFTHDITREISPANPLELLPNGDPFTFNVTFKPFTDVPYTDRMVFYSDASTIDSIAPVCGTGVIAQLIANSYDWGRKRIDRANFPVAPYPVPAANGPVIRLRNDGTSSITIFNVDVVESIHPEAFEINGVPYGPTTFPEFTIPEKSFRDFEVKFHPTVVGEHKLVLSYKNDAGIDATTTLTGIGILPQIATFDANFGITVIDDYTNIQIRTIRISNTNYDWEDSVTITDLDILPTGIEIKPDGTPLEFGSEGFKYDKAALNLPLVIKPGNFIDFPARFVAKHTADHSAALKTVSDAETDVTSNWTGFGLSQGITVTGDNSNICTGTSDQLVCTITNTGTDTLWITDLKLDPAYPDFSINPIALPFYILTNQTVSVPVTFAPTSVVNENIELVVTNNTLKQPEIRAQMNGKSVHYGGVITPTVSAGKVSIGDEFYYQLGFSSTEDLTMAQVKDITLKFTYSKDFLSADLNRINVATNYSYFSIVGTPQAKEIDAVNRIEEVTVVLHSDTQILNGSGPLLSVAFHVFMPWADASSGEKVVIDSIATMSISSLEAGGNTCFDMTGGSVDVQLMPVCVTNLRIISINPSAKYTFLEVNPNPVTSMGADVNFSIALNSYTEVKVYNASGEFVAVVVADNLKAGDYTIPLPIEKLSSGVYFLKLESGPYSKEQKLILQK
ncbi:MAG: Choice-of-anchor protein, partial [Bacteroidota bacterium]|nr:Choice-of-anchor protein [Bacteroidota bacterium]